MSKDQTPPVQPASQTTYHLCSIRVAAAWLVIAAGAGSAAFAGYLDVVSAAAYEGSLGLRVTVSDLSPAYVQDDTPLDETRYYVRFHLRLDGLSIGPEDEVDHFVAYGEGGVVEFRLTVKRDATNTENRLVIAAGSAGGLVILAVENEVWIPDGWHTVEVDWMAADPGQRNGWLELWLDGEPRAQLDALDNEGGRVDAVRWGSVDGRVAATVGTMDVDDFFSGRLGRPSPDPEPLSSLTVTKSGSGSGSVTSAPAGIDCGSDCQETYAADTVVVLTAEPVAGSIFGGWSGHSDCTDGALTMSADRTCTAVFDSEPLASLTVSKSGSGSGRVTSTPVGIDCGSDCQETFAVDTVVVLTGVPVAGSIFGGWSGHSDCTDGTLTMSADRTCTAVFDSEPASTSYTLSVSLNGSGSGTVSSSPAGITCGSECAHDFAAGAEVRLIPAAAAGSIFKGFRGDGDCRDGLVAMDLSVSCTAQFARGRRVRVKVSGQGGLVVSSPAGIECRGDCSADFEAETVALQPLSDPGWEFQEWRGNPDCSDGLLGTDADKECHAVFTRQGNTSSLVFEDGFELGGVSWWAQPGARE